MAMILVGVMGPGEGATDENVRVAHELGRLIAREGWALVTGGRDTGVMDAASRGAKEERGLVIGILPGSGTGGMSTAVDIPIVTGMGEARNWVNVLTCRLLFFVGMNPGAASELALALKAARPAVLVRPHQDVAKVFEQIGGTRIEVAGNAEEAVTLARRLLW